MSEIRFRAFLSGFLFAIFIVSLAESLKSAPFALMLSALCFYKTYPENNDTIKKELDEYKK